MTALTLEQARQKFMEAKARALEAKKLTLDGLSLIAGENEPAERRATVGVTQLNAASRSVDDALRSITADVEHRTGHDVPPVPNPHQGDR